MRGEIINQLGDAGARNNVHILFACEGGSRAWGMASVNSDYDVRYIYVRNYQRYLEINASNHRDTLEGVVGEIDLVGWDLLKALKLLRKSNPSLLEWLASPIRYGQPWAGIEEIAALAKRTYNPLAGFYHYYHMARENFREFLQGNTVKLKKYLYVVRPLLAVRWIRAHGTQPPVKIIALLNSTLPDDWRRKAIRQLIERKKEGEELHEGPRIRAIHDFIAEEMTEIERDPLTTKPPRSDLETANKIFLRALEEHGGLHLEPEEGR